MQPWLSAHPHTIDERFKDDVKEVKEGFECGIKIAGYEDIKEGDEIESYAIEQKARKLSD